MITRGVHLNAFLCFVFPQKRPDVYGLLGQWLIFNFFLITYLVGKISHSNFYFRLPLAKWDGLTILTLTDSTCSRQAFTRAARELVVKHMRTLDLVSWGITGTYQPFRVLGWSTSTWQEDWVPSLKPRWPLKIDGWKMYFLLGMPIFRGYVSFRECILVFFLNGGRPKRKHQQRWPWNNLFLFRYLYVPWKSSLTIF